MHWNLPNTSQTAHCILLCKRCFQLPQKGLESTASLVAQLQVIPAMPNQFQVIPAVASHSTDYKPLYQVEGIESHLGYCNQSN